MIARLIGSTLSAIKKKKAVARRLAKELEEDAVSR